MDFISKLFDLDLAKFVPRMPVFLGWLKAILMLSVLIGPILLVTLGAMYLLRPAPEANFKYGFRTYYGMGSVEAWKFSQKIAGLAYGALGAVLFLIMLIVALTFFKKDLFQIAGNAIVCLLWQVGLTLAARITVGVMCFVYFDRNGDRKKDVPNIRTPQKRQPKYRK